MDKPVTSELQTRWEPTLDWNKWEIPPDPKKKTPGKERAAADRVWVELDWPTCEEANLLAMVGSTNTIAFAFTKRCAKLIHNFPKAGQELTGAELVALPSYRARRAWQLAVNIGSYVFAQTFLSEEEEKN